MDHWASPSSSIFSNISPIRVRALARAQLLAAGIRNDFGFIPPSMRIKIPLNCGGMASVRRADLARPSKILACRAEQEEDEVASESLLPFLCRSSSSSQVIVALPFAIAMVAAPNEQPIEPPEEPQDPCPSPGPLGLVVGSYCHDVLFRDGVVVGEGLGGAASFISNVFDALDRTLHLRCRYVSKVGPDFAYGGRPSLPIPFSSSSSPTTLFHAHFSSSDVAAGYHGDRLLRRVRACDPILPCDLPAEEGHQPFDFGLAVGVAGEISRATLARMIDLCRVVFVDVQALIRTFDPSDGTVRLVHLRDSGFSHLLPRIGFLKASADEAPFLDIDEIRNFCCVVVTDGKDGCTVHWKSGALRVPSFPAIQVDPTGAGDCFLGGLVYGIVHGLPVPDAALLGNLLGSLTVRHIGIPKFHPELFQGVRDELEKRSGGSSGCRGGAKAEPAYQMSTEWGSFQSILAEAADRFSFA